MAQKRRLNLDYVNPLSDKTKLEIGLEARLFNTDAYYDSTGQSFDKNGGIINTPSTDFSYKRDLYSAYITKGKTFKSGAINWVRVRKQLQMMQRP